MKFHWPSFLLGCGIGAMGVLAARRFRPLVVELATAAYQLADTVGARVAMLGEDAEDMLAEARARAHSARPSPRGRARR